MLAINKIYNKGNEHKRQRNLQNIIIPIVIILLIILFILNIESNINACLNGVLVWGKCVLPALFPFFFLTQLLSEYNIIYLVSSKFKFLTKLLFKAPSISAFVFISSIICGYPVGAKLIAEFFQKGAITQKQAHKLLTFCSTSGPLFIIGTVGIGMFGSIKMAYILFFAHIISAILNGILFRSFFTENNNISNNPPINFAKQKNDILYSSMYDSIISILLIGGYISFAFIVIEMLNSTNILSNLSPVMNSIINGMVEVTHGCLDLSKCGLNFTTACVLTGTIISFGGFSVHFQALTFLNKCKIKKWFYFLQKTTHAIITCGVCYVLCLIFK